MAISRRLERTERLWNATRLSLDGSSVFGWGDAFQPSENASEVTLVGEAACERDIGERTRGQQLLGVRHAQLAREGSDRPPVMPPEAAREVRRMDTGAIGQLRERWGMPEGRLQPFSRPPKPRRSDAGALSLPLAVRAREELKNEAFERERRDLVAKRGFAAYAGTQRGDGPAGKDRRRVERWRVERVQPCGIQLEHQETCGVGLESVAMRGTCGMDEERGRSAFRRVAAKALPVPPLHDEADVRARVDVVRNRLAGTIDPLGEVESPDIAFENRRAVEASGAGVFKHVRSISRVGWAKRNRTTRPCLRLPPL